MSTTPTGVTGQEFSRESQQTDQKPAQVQEKAQEVAGQAQEKAQEIAGQTKSKAREQIDQRSTEAGEKVSSTAGDLRSVSEELRKQGKDTPATAADKAAERVEKLGGYLKESDSDRILQDIEDFGRKQPVAVLLGGAAVGFALSRLLKASSSKRYRSYKTQRLEAIPPPSALPAGDAGHSSRFESHG
jgi:hypothetical protein